jgi:hypothetical protein
MNNTSIMERMKTPFFAGLVLILLSFFFTFFKSKIKYDEDERMKVQVSLSGFQAAFGTAPGVHFDFRKSRGDNDYDFGEGLLTSQTKRAVTPRIIGVYFLAVLLLTAWGAAAWLHNGRGGYYNPIATAWAILGVAFVMYLMIGFDISHVRKIIGRDFQISFWKYVSPGAGLWIFLGGLALTFVGAYRQDPPKALAQASVTPPDTHKEIPVVDSPAM